MVTKKKFAKPALKAKPAAAKKPLPKAAPKKAPPLPPPAVVAAAVVVAAKAEGGIIPGKSYVVVAACGVSWNGYSCKLAEGRVLSPGAWGGVAGLERLCKMGVEMEPI